MNLCEADLNRRVEACRDAEVKQDLGNGMMRSIGFYVGYDHMAFSDQCPGGGHGRHGMEMTFRLTGPKGSIVWTGNMHNWYPGNVDTINEVKQIDPISFVPAHYPQLGDGQGIHVTWHAANPQREDHERHDGCEFVPGQDYCYDDITFIGGSELLVEFLAYGPHAVWAALARHYQELQ
jgi:hypothetical protein